MRCLALSALLLTVTMLSCGDAPAPGPDPVKGGGSVQTASAAVTASAAGATETPSAEPSAEVTAPARSAAPNTSSRPSTSSAPIASTATPTASATAVASSAPDVKGDEKKGPSYSAYLSGAGKYKAGVPGAVTAVVSALGQYKVNKEYPFKFTLNAAPAGVTYGETVVRNVVRSEKRASTSIPFTPSSAGTATISGTYSISVCTDEQCVIEKVPLSVTVKVE